MKIIKTERLEIKPYKEGDRAALAEILTNEKIKKTFIIPNFESQEELDKMVNKIIDFSYLEEHFERGIYLNDKLIGFVNDVETDNGEIELGYVIHPAFQGLGFATEMLGAVIYHLFKTKYSKVITGAFIDNLASISVMKKCGMKKTEKEENIVYQGINRSCVYYEIEKQGN